MSFRRVIFLVKKRNLEKGKRDVSTIRPIFNHYSPAHIPKRRSFKNRIGTQLHLQRPKNLDGKERLQHLHISSNHLRFQHKKRKTAKRSPKYLSLKPHLCLPRYLTFDRRRPTSLVSSRKSYDTTRGECW